MLQILEDCIVLSRTLNMPCFRTDETVENNRKNLPTCDQASVVNTTVVYKWRSLRLLRHNKQLLFQEEKNTKKVLDLELSYVDSNIFHWWKKNFKISSNTVRSSIWNIQL